MTITGITFCACCGGYVHPEHGMITEEGIVCEMCSSNNVENNHPDEAPVVQECFV